MSTIADGSVAAPPGNRRRRRLWPRLLLAFFVLLALLAYFAPAIVAGTSLRNTLVRRLVNGLNGTVTAGSASMGWFSPLEFRDVSVTDAAGRPALNVPRITTSLTLKELLAARTDYGEFVFHQPTLEVVSENGTTNVETAIAEFLKPDDQPDSPESSAYVIRVTEGHLLLRDAEQARASDLTGVEITVQVPSAAADPVRVQAKGSVTRPGTTGFLDVDVSIGNAGAASVKSDGFPLEALAPVLRRFDSRLTIGGSLRSDLTANWGSNAAGRSTFKINGTASIAELDLTAPWLRGDHLRLAFVDLPLKLESTGTLLTIAKASITCDLGTASASGLIDYDQALDSLLDQAGIKVQAHLDLAETSKRLPRMMRLREGTEIREGQITLAIGSRAAPTGTTWDGDLRTSSLKAVRGGKPLEWAEPLAIEFSGRFPAGHLPTFDKFICRSDFLAVTARGSAESFKAAANVYLDRLTARLDDFVDLAGIKLDGRATLRVEMTRKPPTGDFQAAGSVEFTNLAFTDPAGRSLREPQLTVRLDASGRYVPNQLARLDAGSLSIAAAEDILDVQLLEPLNDVRKRTAGKLSLRVAGDLARWRSRAREFVAIPAAWQIGGVGNASGTLRFEPDRVSVETLKVDVDRPQFHGAGVDYHDPKLTAEANVALKTAGGTEITNLRLTSATLSVSAPRFAVEPQATGDSALVGNGTFEADLNGLQRILGLALDPKGGDAVAGRTAGDFRFTASAGKTVFQTSFNVRDFVLGPKPTPVWAEPAFKLVVEGELDPAGETLTLAKGRLERDGLTLDARGSWSKLFTSQDLNLTGTVGYDLAKLTPQLRTMVGGGLQASGTGTKPFKLAGNLAPHGVPDALTLSGMTGEAGLGWQDVQAYGFDLGPGELTAKLARGVLTTNRIEAKFGNGTVRVLPTIKLEPGPAEMSIEKGKIIEKANLTPKACAGAVGYALPVIANAARAEGDISFTLAENRFPLGDLTKTTLNGQLLVHKASVGTGPVVGEIAKLLGAATTSVVLANEMTVPIAVANGRVHHQNLRLTVNGFAVTTNGSVGFDGSLSLVADVPVPAQALFKNNPRLMQALTNKTIKVPISGTLQKPILDAKAFENAIAQLVREASKSVATDLIKGGLEKLLQPKK